MRNIEVLAEKAAIEAVGRASKSKVWIHVPRRSPATMSAKRSVPELSELTERLFIAIEACPGEGVSALSQKVGVTSNDLRISARKLVRDGLVKTTGQRQLTRYFPMFSSLGQKEERFGSIRNRSARSGQKRIPDTLDSFGT